MKPTQKITLDFLMKASAILVTVFGLSIPNAEAQTEEVSVLPQYFAANPLIRRDPLFEKMHDYLKTANNNAALGFNENLTQKLKQIETLVNTLELKFTSDASNANPARKIKVTYNLFGYTPDKPLELEAAKVESFIDEISQRVVTQTLEKYPVANNLTASHVAFNKLVLFMIATSLQYEPADIADFNSLDVNEFKADLASNLKEFLKNAFLVKWDAPTNNDFNSSVSDLNVRVQALLEHMKSRIIEKKYELEDIIEKVKKSGNDKLISANAGLGVNQAEGNLGGGIIINFLTDRGLEKKFRGAIFISGVGQIGASDSVAVRQPFLAGANFDFKLDNRTQFTLLASTKYNEEEIGGNHWFFEGGLGCLTRTKGGILVGISAYYQFIDSKIKTVDESNVSEIEEVKINSIFTAGITVRGNSNASPTVMIGASNQNKWTPVLQVSYPINFGQ